MTRFRHLLVGFLLSVLPGMGQTVIYVATNGTHDVPNGFNTLEGAATNIHDAVNLAAIVPGSLVLVSNGVFGVTNTLMVTNSFALESVNGPQATTLFRSGTNNFCFFKVSNVNARVAGFTVTNSFVTAGPSALWLSAGLASNCVLFRCVGGGVSAGGSVTVLADGGLMTGFLVTNCSGYVGTVALRGSGTVEDSRIVTGYGVEFGGLKMNGGVGRRLRIHGNTVHNYGPAGVDLNAGRLENSLIYGNACPIGSTYAGGVRLAGASAQLEHCVVYGNTALAMTAGAGVSRTAGFVRNCILYGNNGSGNANYGGLESAVSNSCAPEFTAGFQGNLSDDPMFVDAAAADFRLLPGSPCRDSGRTLTNIVGDIEGSVRPLSGGTREAAMPDMGAYEMDGAAGPFDIGFYGVLPLKGTNSLAVVFRANATGADREAAWYGWDFDNDGLYELAGSGLATVTNTFGLGLYTVSLLTSNTLGAAAGSTNSLAVTVVADVMHVAANGAHLFPFATWANASTSVHDAALAAVSGCVVKVGSGSFRLTNQITLAEAVAIRGENGPLATTLFRDASRGEFRLFLVQHPGAVVEGLTLTNGYLSSGQAGTAIRLISGLVSNCVITRCSSAGSGGQGASNLRIDGGKVANCVISNNFGYNASVVVTAGQIEDCVIANNSHTDFAGLYLPGGVARRCRMMNNFSKEINYGSGGAWLNGGRLENSLVYGSRAVKNGLGAGVFLAAGVMLNCTVVSNNSPNSAGDGVYRTGGFVTNCIIYGNSTNNNALNDNYYGATSAVWYSCAPELVAATQGNITVNPQLLNLANGGDLRTAGGSPARNSGWAYGGAAGDRDVAGGPRIRQGAIDMGAFEGLPPAGTVMSVR